MDIAAFGDQVTDISIFKGAERHSFLAPRGVFIHQDKLFVADTGRNRVFIWHSIPKSEYQDPDVILGQNNLDASGRNANGCVSASSLHYPSGLWSDGCSVIVADAWNHRVLIWKTFPETHGQPADIVLGQNDFSSNLPNRMGANATPDASSLHWPYGVFSDGKKLFIADTGNRRTLYYNTIPACNTTPADGVIGQTDFNEKEYHLHFPIWPYSAKIDSQGKLAIVDTQFFRTLIWKQYNDAFSHPADVVIGQPDLKNNGQNQYQLHPMPHTLNWCYDACFYKKGLFICDTGNSRVLWFKELPANNNTKADVVVGKRDFITGSENKDTLFGTEASLYWPFSMAVVHDKICIADTGNHRLVFCTLKKE